MALLAARVVPDIDGNPTYIDVTFKWIDAVGDTRSDVVRVDPKATDAQIETAVARILEPSYASLYQVRVAYVYAGEKSKDNATNVAGFSLQRQLGYHAKSADRRSIRAFLPSPRNYLFVADTETPDPTVGALIAWMAAMDVLYPATFSAVSLRFTQKRDIGKKKDL